MLRTASVFFFCPSAARPQAQIVSAYAYFDQYREAFGGGPTCKVLRIGPSAYRCNVGGLFYFARIDEKRISDHLGEQVRGTGEEIYNTCVRSVLHLNLESHTNLHPVTRRYRIVQVVDCHRDSKEDAAPPVTESFPRASETVVEDLKGRGLRACAVRLALPCSA